MKAKYTTVACIGLSTMVLIMAIHVYDGFAEDVRPPDAVPHAGEGFPLEIGQGTNMVSAREVRWIDSHGLECRTYVVFSVGSRHAIATSSTNQVCFLNGKLFTVGIGIQSFWLLASRPVDAIELTAETATSLLESAPRGSPRRKEVNLAPLLKSEIEQHLAQPLILRNVQVRVEDGSVVVDFESYTHLKGKAVLDEQMNVLSATLLDKPKGSVIDY